MMAEGIGPLATLSPRTEGTPQGGPLSPLLSNILLTELDRELERRGHAFLSDTLKLTVNAAKGAAARQWKITSHLPLCWLSGMASSWLRHKLRCILWRQWKRPDTRAMNLMKAGLTEERTFRSAFNQRGAWWNSGASHMNQAFPKLYFDRLGLVSLLDTMRRLCSMNRRMRNRTSGGVGGRRG